MSEEIKVGKVESNKLFIYNGKKYQWINTAEAWRVLCDEDGNQIPPVDIPNDILLNRVKVEIVDE